MVDITNQFWIVGNTNPTSQVWNGPLGQFDANNSAAFFTWLNANDGRADRMQGGTVVATADNGSGAIRVQVTGGTFSTGQVFNFVGNNSGAAGAAAITKIDATHFDIMGSAFSVADTSGTIWSATVIDTFANLMDAINRYNSTLFFSGISPTIVSAGDITLTNPMSLRTAITIAAGHSLILPQMNIPGSIPLGVPFLVIATAGSSPAEVRLSDGTDTGNAIGPKDQMTIVLLNNNSKNGLVGFRFLPGFVGQDLAGGQSDSAIPIVQTSGLTAQWKVVSGDATLADTGALTVTGSGGVPFGPFATLTSPLAVVYGGSQTTVAPAPGQLLIAQSASLYAPTSLTGGATLTAGGTIVLGNPGAAQLGGLFSYAAVANQFLTSLNTSGSLVSAQPAVSGLSGLPVAIIYGGTQTTVAPTSGQILVAQSASLYSPTSLVGGATLAASGTVILANPAAATRGGIFSYSSVANQFLVSLATSGSLTGAQPVFSNIAGTVAASQLSAATTQAVGDNSTLIATDAFVTTAINNAIAGVNPAVSVAAATTGNLPNSPVYNNGVGGIGATITSGTNSVLTLDGYTPILGDRILVKNEAGGLGASRNGVYSVTQLGIAGLIKWILTRALDYDQPSDINSTGAIPVVNGTVNATTQWVITSTVNTVGTDALTYAQFTIAPTSLVQTSRQILTGAGLSGGGDLSADRTLSIDASYLRGYLAGLTLSTAGSSTTMSIAAGVCCSDDFTTLMKLAAFSKTTSAWALGSGNGGLDTGSIAASTWYHFYVIERTDTGVVDVLFSLQPAAGGGGSPTLPTNYTKQRRIGSGKTDASSNWTAFIQDGDRFVWSVPVNDVNAANPGTAAVTRALTVPTGVNVYADLVVGGFNGNADGIATQVYVSDLAVADTAAGALTANTVSAFGLTGTSNSGAMAPAQVRTNTSAQVRTRLAASNANLSLFMNTIGWTDRRGAR
jgi:hypothetical protein